MDGISNTFSIVPKSLGPTAGERIENLVTMLDGYAMAMNDGGALQGLLADLRKVITVRIYNES